MTAPNGAILFNSSTGNDGTASGLGPANPVTVMVMTSAGSNTASASPTSGYSAGDLMYIPSATGRKFNIISNVGSGTLTFDNNWDDSLMGNAAYVGGKRATFDSTSSRQAFSDLAGVSFKTETDQTLTSTLNMGGAFNQIEGASTTQRSVITQTAAASVLNASNNSRLFNLKIQGNGYTAWDGGSSTTLKEAVNVVFGDQTNTIGSAVGTYGAFRFHECVIQYCTGGLNFQSIYSSFSMFNTKYVNNVGSANLTHGTGTNYVIGCLFANNSGVGLIADLYNVKTHISGCTFANNGSHGISGNYPPRYCYDNIFANNGGYGINITNSSKNNEIVFVANNQFYGNTSGNANGFDLGLSPVTTDPQFNDPSSGDFTTSQANSNILGDIESKDRLSRGYAGISSGGGGGSNVHPLYAN